jgi:hypothetical protein
MHEGLTEDSIIEQSWFGPGNARGEYKCDAGMSVQNMPTVVHIKPLKYRFIAHKFSSRCGEDCGQKEVCCWPVCSQVQVRNVLMESKTKQGTLRSTQVLGTSGRCTN